MLKSKVHRIPVSDTDLDYEGSLSLDPELMAAADLYPFEEIDVANLSNGARFSTYVIEGETGDCRLNGAAARLGERGDLLIILAYDLVAEQAAADWKPKIVLAGSPPLH